MAGRTERISSPVDRRPTPLDFRVAAFELQKQIPIESVRVRYVQGKPSRATGLVWFGDLPLGFTAFPAFPPARRIEALGNSVIGVETTNWTAGPAQNPIEAGVFSIPQVGIAEKDMLHEMRRVRGQEEWIERWSALNDMIHNPKEEKQGRKARKIQQNLEFFLSSLLNGQFKAMQEERLKRTIEDTLEKMGAELVRTSNSVGDLKKMLTQAIEAREEEYQTVFNAFTTDTDFRMVFGAAVNIFCDEVTS